MFFPNVALLPITYNLSIKKYTKIYQVSLGRICSIPTYRGFFIEGGYQKGDTNGERTNERGVERH